MFCSTCGIENPDRVKFCRRCGANLSVVTEAIQRGPVITSEIRGELVTRDRAVESLLKKIEQAKPTDQTEWGEAIVPLLMNELKELMMSPEERRQRQIRHGLIVSGIGLGASLFLYIFFRGLTSTGLIPDEVIPILQTFWALGLIPLIIGLTMMLSAWVKKEAPPRHRRSSQTEPEIESAATDPFLGHRAAYKSVTEQTTNLLDTPETDARKDSVHPITDR
jgi:hypothetical protein